MNKKLIKCSVIGSFRKFYDEVKVTIDLLSKNNIKVLSPIKSTIINPGDEFVLFQSDDPSYTSVEIQLVALNRILHSDFVFVCNPEGYIGKTTAYEIGRIVERKIPLYFQEDPIDLPIHLPRNSIKNISDLIQELISSDTLNTYHDYSNSSLLSQKINDKISNKDYYE